jgi:hypothetical protein
MLKHIHLNKQKKTGDCEHRCDRLVLADRLVKIDKSIIIIIIIVVVVVVVVIVVVVVVVVVVVIFRCFAVISIALARAVRLRNR